VYLSLGYLAFWYLGFCVVFNSPGRFSTFVPMSQRKICPATKTHPNISSQWATIRGQFQNPPFIIGKTHGKGRRVLAAVFV
jgi:hypothetical protein